jgi:hypothetical protein
MVLVAQRVGAHRRWWAKGIAAVDLLGNGPGGGGDEGGCDCDHERGVMWTGGRPPSAAAEDGARGRTDTAWRRTSHCLDSLYPQRHINF